MKNSEVLLNKVFLIAFIKLLMCTNIHAKTWINCVFMVYITCLKRNHMWFKKEFKMTKIYVLLFLILYLLPILTQMCTLYHGNTN
jgi:hypothetical protein